MSPITEFRRQTDDPSVAAPPEGVFFGSSEGMQALRETSEKVATSSAPVLIVGETGTGKEILAEILHRKSPWHDRPMFKVNCAVLRGSITGYDPFSDGIIASMAPAGAEGEQDRTILHGTIFLNEIALLDPTLQVRLLEKMREGPLLRFNLPGNKGLELRVICSTSRRLQEDVEAGTFLRELHHLIRVVTLEIPSLRHRRIDIPQLTSYFLELYNRRFGAALPLPSRRVLRMMSEYDWPGNIRELENLIMRYVVRGSEEAFDGELGGREPGAVAPGLPVKGSISLKKVARQAVEELERKIIRKVLEEHHWNRKQAARALNISYRALLYKIKDAGVPPKRVTRAGWLPRSTQHEPAPPHRDKPDEGSA